MSRYRRSLIYPLSNQSTVDEETKRRTRPRRQRSRRRNTIAGTDQKEIEEALNGDRPGNTNTMTTVDDIILSSSSMINSNPKDTKETNADFKKWAFNSLKRWGRSRLRAISSINTSAPSNIVSGELHAADPVDDINVYETVAGKRRGAGNIPISAGLSGPMSLAVKLREGSLGQRRLKINDEPPHSSSGNWSASSESGRASVNSDSSHQPKSSTCSSILPHRRRFINNSTSSSVTSEGTLTPEDMAAVPFLDDGETSSAEHPGATQRWHNLMDCSKSDANLSTIRNEKVYSCDTEGYYTSFHMDSGLKTLKEEEVGTGFSLPPTPMHSTSALSNCSSGRGSASLAQLTAESEYELFGKGSTSTTASSAGTVCTTLLVDNSRGGNNSNGSDRSLCKGPAVPERKSSLNMPCLAQECPPCSTVVALIHNSSQGHSPRSISGDSPDSGHNTSSSPVESMSCPQDSETDALISPIPSITSEMEFSECSDFEGNDRIERIRYKTTINSSRIPSMCVITPPQSDEETCVRQSIMAGFDNSQYPTGYPIECPRAPAPSPGVHVDAMQNAIRNDNHHYSERNSQVTDDNANKPMVDDNYNARSTTPVTSTSVTTVIHVDRNSGYATVHTLDNACKENNNNQKIRPPSPSGGTLFINTKVEDEPRTQFFNQQPLMKEALIPFSNMLKKFRKTSNSGRYSSDTSANDQPKFSSSNTISETLDDSGEYVTITDVRNNNKPDPSPECTPQRSGVTEPACESTDPTWESLEYVSLNELPVSNPTELQPSAILSGSSNESSLERKRRQGARVTLDSEGKVVYSSDSLRRRKGAHTTFAPGQHVKDPSTSPSPSPVANHRTPKAIIRPVQSQASSTLQECYNRNKSDIRSSMKGVIDSDVTVAKPSKSQADEKVVEIRSPLNLNELPVRSTINARKAMNLSQSSDLFNQRNKVIIRAGISSPTKELPKSSSNGTARSLSPRSVLVTRGAYVHMQPDNQSSVKNHPAFLQTDFDGPDDSISPTIAPLRTEKHSEGFSLTTPLRAPLNRTRQSEEGFTSARSTDSQNQPVYQNVSTLSYHQQSHQTGNSSHQPKQAATTASPRFVPSGAIDAPLHSSTPTKPDMTLHSPLTLSHTFSPIEKNVPQSSITYKQREDVLHENCAEVEGPEGTRALEKRKPSLISFPKTTMTSEELYAKIHKSKKQMKIKYEPEIVLSSSPSVCGSQSPASSERSVSPGPGPSAALEPRGTARSRHSWSPNSSKYLDIASNYDHRSCSPSQNPQSPKEHGLTQVTSTYDFKRLLLQHGTGTTGRSKLSAVERLKLAKQAATNVFTNNASKFRFAAGGNSGTGTSTATSILSQGTPLLLNSRAVPSKPSFSKPMSKSIRRYANSKSDVRSTPILEDNGEDEHNQSILQIQTLSASPMPARNVERIVGKRVNIQEKTQQPIQAQSVDATPCPGPSQNKIMTPNLIFRNAQIPSASQLTRFVNTQPLGNARQITSQSVRDPAAGKSQEYHKHQAALETAL